MKTFSGKVLFLDRSDINTDEIIPAKYLTEITKAALKPYLLEDLFLEGFSTSDLKGKAVIVTRANFGCGSSREHAPVAIKASGISVVIAASFARIFYRNGINIGLPLLAIGDDAEKISRKDKLSVDTTTGEIKNLTTGDVFHAHPLPGFVEDIAKAGGLINYIKEKKNNA